MKGVSGIVASAILLALTIAGGLLLYAYVSRYLAVSIQSGELVIENAYYLKPVGRLEVTVRNIGMSAASIEKIEVILENAESLYIDQSVILTPGETKTISVNIDTATRPIYVVIQYDRERRTEPIPVRVIG
ncbi:MAG: archaellin/type IV pilin N-terminal domain-containing protein [Desulfurococcaceae archaeon]